jgi:hypothetical protein
MLFKVTFNIDKAISRIYVKASGPVDSAGYIDTCIAFYKSIPSAWKYQRLVDLRETTGTINYADIIRLSQFWSSTPQSRNPVRTATLVATKEELSRNPSVSLLVPTHFVRAFLDEAEALVWLDEDLDNRTAAS